MMPHGARVNKIEEEDSISPVLVVRSPLTQRRGRNELMEQEGTKQLHAPSLLQVARVWERDCFQFSHELVVAMLDCSTPGPCINSVPTTLDQSFRVWRS